MLSRIAQEFVGEEWRLDVVATRSLIDARECIATGVELPNGDVRSEPHALQDDFGEVRHDGLMRRLCRELERCFEQKSHHIDVAATRQSE